MRNIYTMPAWKVAALFFGTFVGGMAIFGVLGGVAAAVGALAGWGIMYDHVKKEVEKNK